MAAASPARPPHVTKSQPTLTNRPCSDSTPREATVNPHYHFQNTALLHVPNLQVVGSMVQIFKSSQFYDFDFKNTSVAYLNRYPNPYAKHVLSSDTIECYVDSEGRLNTTRLVVKKGSLPDFIKPFLGQSLESWVIEKSIIDRNSQKVLAYSANVDHRRFIKIQEFLTYDCSSGSTNLQVNVRFSSNFFGLKRKIEQWSRDKFTNNLSNHREGFIYVMNKFKRSATAPLA
ncbi:hypothetical protein OXX69_000152 [Metschnikowia pulcherrima]